MPLQLHSRFGAKLLEIRVERVFVAAKGLTTVAATGSTGRGFDCILIVFRSYFDCILIVFWLHFDCILIVF